MATELDDLRSFLMVARTRGFREAARLAGTSASTLSEAVRRLEAQLEVRLFHRTTRSVTPTEAGAKLMDRLSPALRELEAVLHDFERENSGPAGTLRLNVPISAARLVLPSILPAFLAAYPDIDVEVTAEDSFVDVLAAGCDAGIRYGERLEQDVIAVSIGPRIQRIATAASQAYLDRCGRPQHPRDLLSHACLIGRFSGGALTSPWEFERAGEIVRVEPSARLVVSVISSDLAIAAAVAGSGIIHLFESWLEPSLANDALEPVLSDWWQPFPGPFLYYSDRRLVPAPLRAFLDFVKAAPQG